MVFLYCALLSAAGAPPPARVEQRSRASVNILQPHSASAKTWNPAARRDQKIIMKREVDGSFILLRLTEFE